MRNNPVKVRLRRGEPSFGTWLSLGSLPAARLLARAGFDWLTLDLEHAAVDWETASAILGAVADAGCVPLVRVPEGTHHHIKRALDAGAYGVVVPMVETPEQARAAIAAAKYPPEGDRSAGGLTHALNFGAELDEYFARANEEILVVLQTESPRGIDNAEAIYALPGCDAVFVGPTDLRCRMRAADGCPPSDDQFEAALRRVVEAGRRAGTPTGIHAGDAQEARRRAAEGMQFIAIATDATLLLVKASETLRILHQVDR